MFSIQLDFGPLQDKANTVVTLVPARCSCWITWLMQRPCGLSNLAVLPEVSFIVLNLNTALY